MIVVDASVITDALIGRSAALDALDDALATGPGQALHAPELIEPEVLNALRGLARGGTVTAAHGNAAVTDFGQLRLQRHTHAPLRVRVWELRDRLSAYDATYLALAEALDATQLLTGDGGLAEVASQSLGPSRVRRVR